MPLSGNDHHVQPRPSSVPPIDFSQTPLTIILSGLIENILAYTRGNQIKAAIILGLNRNTLRKKILELGVTVRKVRKNSL